MSSQDTRGAILCLTVLACGPAFSWQLSSFLHAKEAVLVTGIALVGISAAIRPGLSKSLIIPFLPLWFLLAWSLVVHILFGQARVPAYVVSEVVRLCTLLILGTIGLVVFREPRWRSRLSDCLILSALIVATLALIQISDVFPELFPEFEYFIQPVYSVFGNQGLLGAYMALAIPLALTKLADSTPPKSYKYAVALAVLLSVLAISQSRTAWFAAVVGSACCLPYLRIQKTSIPKLAVLSLLALGLIFIVLSQNPHGKIRNTFSDKDVGSMARVWYWDGAIRMIRDHPLAGVGLGNFHYWSPHYLGEALHEDAQRVRFHNEAHTIHAHSDLLEVLAESGVVGLLCVLWMLWRLRRCRGPEWGGLAALGVYSLANATYTMPAHALAAVMLIACMLSSDTPLETSAGSESRAFSFALSALCLALGAFTTIAMLVPSYRLERAFDAKKNNLPADALFERARAGLWPNYSAHEEYGLYLLDHERYAEARMPLHEASLGIDTGRLHYLSAVAARETGDIKTAREEFERCAWRWPGNVFAWSGLLEILEGQQREAQTQEALRWIKPEDHPLLFP